jgi:hypothetical protein
MSWKVIWRDRGGAEKRTETPSLGSALIQADHDRSRGLEVVGIEGPDSEFISVDELRSGENAGEERTFLRS